MIRWLNDNKKLILNEDDEPKHFGYIYKMTMIPTGKIYVGKKESSTADKKYYRSGRDWKIDLATYGPENVKVEILDWADSRQELREKEIYWIAKLHAQDKSIGYNVHKGGAGGNSLGDTEAWAELHRGERNGRYGVPVSQETRDKIGAANNGKVRSQEFKDHISQALKGVPKPDGFGDKVSARMKGVPKSDSTKEKISKALTGTSWGNHTEETKDKISKALTGRDGLKGEANGMYGKNHTDDSKALMSKNRKGKTAGGNNPKARPVVCIETGKVYPCIKDAELDTGARYVSRVCSGQKEVSSIVPLHWRYATDED